MCVIPYLLVIINAFSIVWSRFISRFIFKAFNAFAIIRPREYSETLAWAINPFPAATTRVIALAISQTLALAVTQRPAGGVLAGVHFGQRLNKRVNFKWTLDRPGCPSFIMCVFAFHGCWLFPALCVDDPAWIFNSSGGFGNYIEACSVLPQWCQRFSDYERKKTLTFLYGFYVA